MSMKTSSKLKPSEMSPEVRAMIDVRHQAEQRGHFEPLGRLVSLETAHGVIEFGTQQGEATGPDLASMFEERENGGVGRADALLVLGAWTGLPELRRNSQVPCAKCKHICDICEGFGKKQCEGLDCGGRGWIGGNWVSCPGPGCHAETGQYKDDCAKCLKSEVRGMVREQVVCPMCKGERGPNGFTVMTCSGCRGTKKRSTGRVNGSLDWRLPACKACAGTGWKGEFVKQDVNKFTNAELSADTHKQKANVDKFLRYTSFLALGPIHSFILKDFGTRRIRSFEVSQDSAGDFLMLLVPKVVRGSRSKAYLVGGVVREVGSGERVA
jgi:hypothetical protein